MRSAHLEEKYAPSDARYKSILDHVGPLEVGLTSLGETPSGLSVVIHADAAARALALA